MEKINKSLISWASIGKSKTRWTPFGPTMVGTDKATFETPR